MSLRIWLPLNGNLDNLGLDAVEVVNNGATIDNSGKIGQCYYFNGSSYINVVGLDINNSWSYGCWFKEEASSRTWGGMIILNNNGGDADMQFGFYTYPTGSKFQTTANGQYNSSVAHTFDNKWHHLFATFDGSSLKTYRDGTLINTKTITASMLKRSNLTLGARRRTSSYDCYWKGYMNDFRVYDHALSPKEVEEISKGLILHYKLDDPVLESTTNLITTEDCLSSTCYNGATSKYGYGATSDIYKQVTTFEGRKGTKVYMGTNGKNAFPYVYISNMFTSDGTNQPAYKTLSFDYYTNIGTSIRPYKLGSGSGTATYKIINSNGTFTGTGTDAVSIPVVTSGWNHIEITFHGTTAANAEWGYIQNYPSHTSNTNNFWFFANMQLETKDHATGYAGYGATRGSGLLHDNSGNMNDGTSNNIVISEDSPKYGLSSIFNGTNSYVKVTNNNWNPQGMEQITLNIWAKAATWPNNGGRLLSCTETGGFNLEGGNSGYWRFPIHVYTNAEKTSTAYKYDGKEILISSLIPDEWNMITLVYDAATGTKTYINGELHHTYSNVSYGIHFNMNARLFLGCEANAASAYTPYFNGKESDFRIYATALTAEQIKELYDTSMGIDSNGNVYVREVVE